MSLEEALKAQLVGYPALNTLIGGRVLAMAITELTELPAITYTRISSPPLQHRSGSKTARVRFQIDGWTLDPGQSVALRTQIRAAMAAWRRSDSPRVDMALLQDDRDLREPQNNRLRASLDFLVIAEEN